VVSPKSPKLNVREAKFVKAKAQGLSNTKAAMIATGTTSVDSAKTLGHRLSTNVNVQEAIQAEMAKQGITLEAIIKPVKEALAAEKVHIVGNGDQAMADVVPDHSVRLKAVSIASQFMGIGKNTEGGNTNFNFINLSKNDADNFGI